MTTHAQPSPWQVFVFKESGGCAKRDREVIPQYPQRPKVARRQFDVNYPPLPVSWRRSREVERKVLDVMRNGSRKKALRAIPLPRIQKILTLFSAVI